HRELAVVVERHHHALLRGGLLDRRRDRGRLLAREEGGHRIAGRRGDELLESEALVVAAERDVLERHHREVPDLGHEVVQLADLESHGTRQLVVRRLATELVLELLRAPDQVVRLLADGARHPVERAQLVEDRAADADAGVGLEVRRLPGIELLERVEEAVHAPAHHLVVLDRRGESALDLLDDLPHEREVRAEVFIGAARARARLAQRSASPPPRRMLPSRRPVSVVARRPRSAPHGIAPLGPDPAGKAGEKVVLAVAATPMPLCTNLFAFPREPRPSLAISLQARETRGVSPAPKRARRSRHRASPAPGRNAAARAGGEPLTVATRMPRSVEVRRRPRTSISDGK